MCGIAGILVSDPRQLNISTLKSMTDAIVHRGLDGEGHWISSDGTVGLGNRRLAIIDLSEAGKQPMHYMDRYTITYNGEIYNYTELKEQLKKNGYSFSSQTDTEVIMAMYDWKKAGCLQYFDGMFSFALYDAAEKKLFCARDRFGEKPFFYHFIPGKKFVFGSEMKALWAEGVSHGINEKMLYRYLVYNEEHNAAAPEETFFAEIKKLPPSHAITFSTTDFSVNIQQYWQIDPLQQDHSLSEQEAINKFTGLFYTSVKRRLRSDVEVGSSLSGGLDSSLVVKAIHDIDRENNENASRNAFSAQFPGFIKDENHYQDIVVKQTGFVHHVVKPAAETMLANLETIFKHQEEPFGSNSVNAQFEVHGLAKKNNVIVLLDGQGADELLAGYPGEYIVPFLKGIKNRKEFLQQLKQFRKLHRNNKINPYHRLFWKALLPNSIVKVGRKFIKPVDNSWLNKDFAHAFQYEKEATKETRNLNKALYKSAFGGGLETLLRYADRNSMAHSVEVRLPYLSHELAEFLFSLPDHFKIHNGWTKWIARQTFDKKLPGEIIWRKEKIGFEPPDKNFKILATSASYSFSKDLKNYISTEAGMKPKYIWKTIMLDHLMTRK